jgi:NAD+ diphosphatase
VPRSPNPYSGPYLDRIAHLRKDATFVATALGGGHARIVSISDSRGLVRRGPDGWSAVYLDGAHVLQLGLDCNEFVLLGESAGHVYFAAELDANRASSVATDDSLRFEDLRIAGGLLPATDAGVLAYAKAMLYWRGRHRFCGACGAVTVPQSAGHVMKCSNEACGADHFPRLDPAIIVLVSDGERALLGRQASWPEGRYSTIAGFVEPGESLEDAVAREVREETGVDVLDAEYHSSQPWPFPSSLMVAFIARAGDGAVARADEELEDVGWFSRADIAAGRPVLPPPQSVAFRLIEDWYDAGSAVPLRQTAGAKLWGRG